MKMVLTVTAVSVLSFSTAFPAQSNTAVSSGNISKCRVWGFPYTLYDNAVTTRTINSGVTVTVNQDRHAAAVNFSGNGALVMSDINSLIMSGSGTEIACRWDLQDRGDHTMVNNTIGSASGPVYLPAVFTAPYDGYYLWYRANGWDASISGAYLKGDVTVQSNNGLYATVFSQDEPGSCGTAPGGTGTLPADWKHAINFNLSSGHTLFYGASTAYSTDPACNSTTMTFTAGTAFVVLDN